MKLTPIRVRGKRGQSKAANHGKRPNSTNPTAEEASNGEVKRAKTHHEGKKKLPQLPQEILERIFVASENLALPLVNRELYHRLSTDSVKYQLVGAAFGPTWDAWYGLDNDEVQSYYGWVSDAGRIAGDPTFQSAILACSWAKLPLLLESFNVWIRQHANGRPYFSPAALDGDGTEGLAGEEVRVILGNMKSKFQYDAWFFASNMAQTPLGHWNWCHSEMALSCRALLGQHLEINPGALIPDDLLAGPFFHNKDDGNESETNQEQERGVEGKQKYKKGPFAMGVEKFERLFWLVRGGARLQAEQTWETSHEGFQAILKLIVEIANKEEKASDLRGVDAAYASEEGLLKLAAGLFQLFNILGVFGSQWPLYILNISLAEVSQFISTVPKDSLPELLLDNMAVALRAATHGGEMARVYALTGHRWQCPATQEVIQERYQEGFWLVPEDPRSIYSLPGVYYQMGCHRALYLDTALAVARARQQQPAGTGNGQGREEGGVGGAARRVPGPKVFRRRFVADLRATGAEFRHAGEMMTYTTLIPVGPAEELPVENDGDYVVV